MIKSTPLILLLCASCILFSCKKNNTAYTGANTGVLLKSASGDCMPIKVAGSYAAGTLLTAANFIEVQLNYSTEGVYQISTDTINGFYFRGQGAIPAGTSTVRLFAHGTPVFNETDFFTVKQGATSCTATVTVGGVSAPPVAVITLGGAGSTCTGAVLAGSYIVGTAMNISNKVTLNITAISSGTYNITTPNVNGVHFSGSGTISSSGAGTIVLTASGTGLLAATSTFAVTIGGSTCSFNVTFSPVAAPAGYTLNCAGAIATGVYTSGTALTTANTITLQATSTGAGAYNITTLPVNGVTFTSSGSFTGAGNFPVILRATGNIPAAGGSFNYVASGGSSSCTFSVTFATATGTCNTPNNTSTSNIIGVGGDTFTSVSGFGSGGIYTVDCNATGGNMVLNFNGNAVPADGDYTASGGYFAMGSTDVGVYYSVSPYDFVMLTGTVHVITVPGGKQMSFCTEHFSNPVSSFVILMSAKVTVP